MRSRSRGTALLFAGLLAASGCATPQSAHRKIFAMGTTLEIQTTAANPASALEASEAAFREVQTTEARLSTWRKDSELSQLNAADAGLPFKISDALREDLSVALYWSDQTDSFFHPGLGALVNLWDLRAARGLHETPSPAKLRRTVAGIHTKNFRLERNSATRLSPAFLIEEGAFGKGIALDRAARAALSSGAKDVLLDFGGQVLSLGESKKPIKIFLAHPTERETRIAEWSIPSGSLSTSGTSERGRHIIDSKTGNLVLATGSSTVWAKDATAADILSTAMLAMGPETFFSWLKKHREYSIRAAFAANPDSLGEVRITASCELDGQLIALDSRVRIEFLCPDSKSQTERKAFGHAHYPS
jgi:FAD:protein FMN transferase